MTKAMRDNASLNRLAGTMSKLKVDVGETKCSSSIEGLHTKPQVLSEKLYLNSIVISSGYEATFSLASGRKYTAPAELNSP